MTPRNASGTDAGRISSATFVLLTILCTTVACGKDSASPIAPSSTSSTPLSIEGVVRHRTDGHGLVGARVEIADGANKGLQASTDDQGRYRLNDLLPGSLVLRAAADGFAASTQSLTLSDNQTLDFALDPSSVAPPPGVETFVLSGSVTDSGNEAPIAAARVQVVGGPGRGAATESDARGRYALNVQPGSMTIEVSAPSYRVRSQSLTLNTDQVLDVELERDGRGDPEPPPPPSGPVVKGTTVDGVSNGTVAGARVQVDGSGEATSLKDGTFEVRLSSPDTVVEVTVASASTVERRTRVRVTTGPAILTLMPKSLNLVAFDQMFRADGTLRRWTTAPAVVIQRRVLQFTDVDAANAVATSVVLSDAEVDAIAGDLTEVLPALTGQAFDRFAHQSVETAAEGESVTTARTGVIVVAQYQGLTNATTYWGYTRWAWNDRGELRAGSIMLDRGFETSGSPYRRTLRAHELGHALGYSHVDARESVMNSSARVPITDFDRNGARMAFLRPPLNMTPDIDPEPMTVNRAPGGLTWTGSR